VCNFEIIVNAYVGIKDLFDSEISIFPNPTNGFININTSEHYDITVTDISGRILKTYSNSENRFILNISNFNKGIYFINFSNNSHIISKKVVLK